jgi:hypothetical protein
MSISHEAYERLLLGLKYRHLPERQGIYWASAFKELTGCSRALFICVKNVLGRPPEIGCLEEAGYGTHRDGLYDVVYHSLDQDPVFQRVSQKIAGGVHTFTDTDQTLFDVPAQGDEALMQAIWQSKKTGMGSYVGFAGGLNVHDSGTRFSSIHLQFTDSACTPEAVEAVTSFTKGWKTLYQLKLLGPLIEHEFDWSEREGEILACLCAGMSFKEIGKALDLSQYRVRDVFHQTRKKVVGARIVSTMPMKTKLGVKKVTELVGKFGAVDPELIAELRDRAEKRTSGAQKREALP